jgi:hypothetical protein
LDWLTILIVATVAIGGLWNVYEANAPMIEVVPRFTLSDGPLNWLRQNDPTTYYIDVPISTAWHQGILSREFYWINAWYGWELLSTPQSDWNMTIPADSSHGKYLIVPDIVPPIENNARLLTSISHHNIYLLRDSLPYTFVYNPTDPQPAEVTEAAARWPNPNELDVRAIATADETLVVQVMSYPGWSVSVDGSAQPLLDASGFLAVAAQPGRHTYRFSFSPLSAKLGLICSMLAIGLLIVYGLRRRKPNR